MPGIGCFKKLFFIFFSSCAYSFFPKIKKNISTFSVSCNSSIANGFVDIDDKFKILLKEEISKISKFFFVEKYGDIDFKIKILEIKISSKAVPADEDSNIGKIQNLSIKVEFDFYDKKNKIELKKLEVSESIDIDSEENLFLSKNNRIMEVLKKISKVIIEKTILE
jgi:hypothetical protein